MARKAASINKTNKIRINKWIKSISDKISNVDELAIQLNKTILRDIHALKECSEKSIVVQYLDKMDKICKSMDSNVWSADIMDSTVTPLVRSSLAQKYTGSQVYDNNIDIYFNEVKREYILHPMNESDDLEFLPENREIFIKNNLKLVINCAKRYRGLGLPFEDLIQIGNYGLLVAFEKFDKDRANLRVAINNGIDNAGLDYFSYDDAATIVRNAFTYDKDLDRALKAIPIDGFESPEMFKSWTKVNIKTAVFASVAFQWIRAYILLELSKLGQTVRIPKSSKQEGQENVQNIISLDAINPHTNDNYHDNTISEVANEQFIVEDEALDKEYNEAIFRDIVYKAMRTLSGFERRIVKKKFGIGFPFAMSINEIAESEGVVNAKIKYALNSSMKAIDENISPRDRAILKDILL